MIWAGMETSPNGDHCNFAVEVLNNTSEVSIIGSSYKDFVRNSDLPITPALTRQSMAGSGDRIWKESPNTNIESTTWQGRPILNSSFPKEGLLTRQNLGVDNFRALKRSGGYRGYHTWDTPVTERFNFHAVDTTRTHANAGSHVLVNINSNDTSRAIHFNRNQHGRWMKFSGEWVWATINITTPITNPMSYNDGGGQDRQDLITVSGNNNRIMLNVLSDFHFGGFSWTSSDSSNSIFDIDGSNNLVVLNVYQGATFWMKENGSGSTRNNHISDTVGNNKIVFNVFGGGVKFW